MKSNMVRGIASNKLSALRMLGVSATHGTLRTCSVCEIPVQRKSGGGIFKVRRHSTQCNVETTHFDSVPIQNERLLNYESGSRERTEVKAALAAVLNEVECVPIVINGDEMHDNCHLMQNLPYNRSHCVARYNQANRAIIEIAIEKAVEAQKTWSNSKLEDRMAIWDAAADLIAGKYRFKIVAAIMVGQAKTLRQAEMDVAELVDFMRISPIFLRDLANYELLNNKPETCRNHLKLRSLTGFVAAISPFNYTSIAGNLAYTPALMGNAVLWKPSDSAILSNWFVFQAMREAGVPDGVVNFIPASPTCFSTVITESPKLAGINFIGTGGVFKLLWQMVAENIDKYHNYPRVVGGCGGKNFHFVHASAKPSEVVACTIRAAFEYAGQKCSSCSMLYVPESLWESEIQDSLINNTRKLFVSDSTYCDCFYSAVINSNAFERIFMYLRYMHSSSTCTILLGGSGSKGLGFFIDPTIVLVKDLDEVVCKEEILGPILCVYVYKDREVQKTMEKVAQINRGLTGSIFATDSAFIKEACKAFQNNVGNLNINDKCTGAIVAQQPFGGAQMTGNNEKLGSPYSLLRWTTLQVIKESFVPHENVYYPYMEISEKDDVENETLKSRKSSDFPHPN